MNYRQKLGYTLLGAVIMLTGMTVDSILAPPSVAQRNGIFDEIECSELTVRGPNGKRAITLSSHPTSGTEINLYDQAGTRRINVQADTDGSYMKINHKGTPSITIIADKDGVILTMDNAQGKELIHLGADDHMRNLSLKHPDGTSAADIVSLGNGSTNVLSLRNRDGAKALELGCDDGMSRGMTIYNNAGKKSATLLTGERSGKHALTIYDAGRAVLRAP